MQLENLKTKSEYGTLQLPPGAQNFRIWYIFSHDTINMNMRKPTYPMTLTSSDVVIRGMVTVTPPSAKHLEQISTFWRRWY